MKLTLSDAPLFSVVADKKRRGPFSLFSSTKLKYFLIWSKEGFFGLSVQQNSCRPSFLHSTVSSYNSKCSRKSMWSYWSWWQPCAALLQGLKVTWMPQQPNTLTVYHWIIQSSQKGVDFISSRSVTWNWVQMWSLTRMVWRLRWWLYLFARSFVQTRPGDGHFSTIFSEQLKLWVNGEHV